jgi:hypothetical protein
MAQTTLIDIAIANGADAVTGLIDETIKVTPEMQIIPARTIKGLNFRTLVRTSLPTAAFRRANEGTALSKSTFENRLVETFILNPQWNCDKAVADVYEDGAEAYIALEAGGIVTASWQTLAKQMYYGAVSTLGDSLGHPGLLDFVDSGFVVDATGTTDNVCSSLWAIKLGPQDVQWVFGNNGQLQMAPVREQSIIDSNNKQYTAYIQEMMARPGIQCNRKYAVGRIKKLTTDSGKGLTDALISSLLALFPVGFKPDVLFCTRRSLKQLQQSRTATNATGAPAPQPTEAFGYPIYATDALLDTETLAL